MTVTGLRGRKARTDRKTALESIFPDLMRIHQRLDGIEHDFSGIKPQLVELVHSLLRLEKDAQNAERRTLRAKMVETLKTVSAGFCVE